MVTVPRILLEQLYELLDELDDGLLTREQTCPSCSEHPHQWWCAFLYLMGRLKQLCELPAEPQ